MHWLGHGCVAGCFTGEDRGETGARERRAGVVARAWRQERARERSRRPRWRARHRAAWDAGEEDVKGGVGLGRLEWWASPWATGNSFPLILFNLSFLFFVICFGSDKNTKPFH